MSLTDQLKAKAQELGFALAGVTAPDPPPHVEFYESWLSAGRHGPMGYLATERARRRRADPREILPGCRSILVLATKYASPPGPTCPEPVGVSQRQIPLGEGEKRKRGRIAGYAAGRDYHEVLQSRMRSLVAWLEAEVGHPIPHKLYVDTGPVLERDLAQRAGLGWIGKNTCLIAPRLGSYLLLSEIFLALNLETDSPFLPDYCGTCTRCIEACPTTCILPGRVLDASRCISTLTIELKGPIPMELRPQMGEWVFGCDICQQVCPWNRFALAPQAPSPSGRGLGGEGEPLVSELSLTPDQFRQMFRHSPVKRAKRRGYLRNVAVALGNSRNPEAIPALKAALSDVEPLVRSHAAWALGEIGGEAAFSALAAATAEERDAEVQTELRLAQQKTRYG